MDGRERGAYLSLIVRMWCTPLPDSPGEVWHSEVEHIQSGQRWHFYRLEEMLAFLATPQALLPQDHTPPQQDRGPESGT